MLRTPLVLLICVAGACAPATEKPQEQTRDDLSQLQFLEGRWQGMGPDGSAFYEQYDFPDRSTMRSRRFADVSFSNSSDSSIVSLKEGVITSQWGEFTWQATEIKEGEACFSPVNAPSSFCWQRVSDAIVHVTQRWTDESGQPQEYVVPLQRL